MGWGLGRVIGWVLWLETVANMFWYYAILLFVSVYVDGRRFLRVRRLERY